MSLTVNGLNTPKKIGWNEDDLEAFAKRHPIVGDQVEHILTKASYQGGPKVTRVMALKEAIGEYLQRHPGAASELPLYFSAIAPMAPFLGPSETIPRPVRPVPDYRDESDFLEV